MKLKLILAVVVSYFIVTQAFIIKYDGSSVQLFPKLSDYKIYSGKPSDLIPEKEFIRYDLATTLFTDYAEKQRLVKVPSGYKLNAVTDGLPQFPDGTILSKTFFYWKDKRDTSKGKNIIETRILIKVNNEWQGGTYVWDAEQNEALLTTSGLKKSISWIDGNGIENSVKYQVPSANQCGSCHNSGNELNPIGFKIRNLNINVVRNGSVINQLRFFNSAGITKDIDPGSYSTLPAWNNTSYPLEQRVRAYLEVNCAHCHNENGFCSGSDFRPAYENSFADTKIYEKKDKIFKFLKSGRMPLLGTTIVHKEGVQLIEDYIKTLK